MVESAVFCYSRHPLNRITKLIWEEASAGKTSFGSLRMQWRDNVWSEIRTTEITTDPAIMVHRIRWKQVVRQDHPWVVVLQEEGEDKERVLLSQEFAAKNKRKGVV